MSVSLWLTVISAINFFKRLRLHNSDNFGHSFSSTSTSREKENSFAQVGTALLPSPWGQHQESPRAAAANNCPFELNFCFIPYPSPEQPNNNCQLQLQQYRYKSTCNSCNNNSSSNNNGKLQLQTVIPKSSLV